MLRNTLDIRRRIRAPLRSIGRAAILIACLGPAAALPAQVDPFYSSLLERGGHELETGRAAEAERKLRIASFGLLDRPDLLAECLVQLGRAQSATGSLSGLGKTVERLAEIEREFGAYSALAASSAKTAFEDVLRAAKLPGIAAGGLLLSSAEPTAASTPPPAPSERQQRKALEQRLAANPADHEALWELARLDLADDKPKRAAARLDRLLEHQPGHVPSLCLRAEIAAPRGECAPALAAYRACPTLLGQDAMAALVLDCLIASGRHTEAGELFAALPADRRGAPALATAADHMARPEDGAVAVSETGEPDEPGAPLSLENDAAATASPGVETTAGPRILIGVPLEEQLRRLRAALAAARVRSDLTVPMESAVRLAAEHPESIAAQHLAAEIAFRAADYPTAIEYFARGGEPGPDQHVLLFSLAVANFETGELEEARRLLLAALPRLEAAQPSEYVRSYIERIQAGPPL